MSAASTTAHLLTAITEALTTDRTDPSRPRALTSTQLFVKGYPPGYDRGVRSVRARVRPGAFALIVRQQPLPGVADEIASEHLYRVTIVVSRDYHLGYELDPSTVHATMARVADDSMRVRSALCWPGALEETADGDPTGMAGSALEPLDALGVVSIETVGDGRDRLVNARDTYTAIFRYAPDA